MGSDSQGSLVRSFKGNHGKGVPLALALLMLTATLSGCLGGEETTESVDITPNTDQIEANNLTISQLLANISHLSMGLNPIDMNLESWLNR